MHLDPEYYNELKEQYTEATYTDIEEDLCSLDGMFISEKYLLKREEV